MRQATNSPARTGPDFLRVFGARANNLRNLDVEFPHRSLVVVTGVSGSGKTSLAYGTVYAEAQRRQLQPLSAFARQLVGGSLRPDVDAVDGVCAAVSVGQVRSGGNQRSTVGTATDIHDYLRSLFAVVGTADGGADTAPEMTARAFSFNSSAHACAGCDGLGVRLQGDPELIVHDPSLSLRDGVLRPWQDPRASVEHELSLRFAESLGADPDTPWSALDPRVRDRLLFAEGATLRAELTIRGVRTVRETRFVGVVPWLAAALRDASGESARRRATAFMSTGRCGSCGGGRLNPAQLSVRIAGRNIADVVGMEITEALEFFGSLESRTGASAPVRQGVTEITSRLADLVDVGLGYLTLDRPVPTLSGGEAQRLRLATHLGMAVFGMMYVFDEPSAGLHPDDTRRLLRSLQRLRDQGNSVVVVEHDLSIIEAADWVVEVGPGPGEHGGRLLHSGPVESLLACPESVTAPYLRERSTRRVSSARPLEKFVEIEGAEAHNLRSLSVRFPLNAFTAITGVSGVGKSSLLNQVVEPAVAIATGDGSRPAPRCAAVSGLEKVARLVSIDQSPIGRSPRSNVATYIGVFDRIRRMFAATEAAKARGFGPGTFSFNNAGGRCEACEGDGTLQVEMFFLPDVQLRCDVCEGRRFAAPTLEVQVRGHTIADVLDLTVDRAAEVFADVKGVSGPLDALRDVGLGYVRLGQSATTFSGGEAQRIKLAREFAGSTAAQTCYLLDEPTNGLHAADVARLVAVLVSLVERGGTVVAVTHHPEVMAAADWIVELGHGGGRHGGRLAAQGTPDSIAGLDTPTGRVLAP